MLIDNLGAKLDFDRNHWCKMYRVQQAVSESAAAFGTGFLLLLDLSLPSFAFWSARKGLHKNLLAGSTTPTGSFE